MEQSLKTQLPELEANVLLKNLDRRTQALAVLNGPAGPNRWLTALACGSAAGAASYLLKGAAIPDIVAALLVGAMAGLAGTLMERRALNRRLDAAVELLRLHENERT